jgi:hypothetical protein
MALDFWQNIPTLPGPSAVLAGSSMRVLPFNLPDTINLGTFQMFLVNGVGAGNITYRCGLYSLNASTLSLENSWSFTLALPNGAPDGGYRSCSTFSKTQNITPGTWFIGMLESKGGANGGNILVGGDPDQANAFPGKFIGGLLTVTSSSVPVSVATSDISQTASNAMAWPYIIISA